MLLKDYLLIIDFKVNRRYMDHSDSDSSPLNAVILHHDDIRRKEQASSELRTRKEQPLSKTEMHSAKSTDKVGCGKEAKDSGRR